MKRIYISTINKSFNFFAVLLILLLAACSFEKKTGFNRFMQNLTTQYNILYNANEILRQKQETYAGSYIDQYANILSVYQDTIAHTGAADKDLDAVIFRANTIINEKEQSKYIGAAYLVMGKANYLDGKYFDAVELFSYVIRSFPTEIKLTQEAYAWKIRALLYLNNQAEAKAALDSAFLDIDPKKQKHLPAEVYAAALQYDINTQNYVDAEVAAKNAIGYSKNTPEKLRWTFILGQLQELNHKNDDALTTYNSIVKSNASFEMAFNANLNRIRIQEMRNGVKVNRINLLLSLLKDENNADFNDQIYFQVAEIYAANKDIPNALKYYRLSARSSLKNQNQKGLAYLRIADVDFNNLADYVGAKKYYDSTLTNLSPTYPGYQTIQKKSNNLQVLVDKLQIIAREDTLQNLAKLDEATRTKTIDSLVNARILQQQNAANTVNAGNMGNTSLGQANNPFGKSAARPTGQAATGSSFYFYNSTAVSQGFTEFKRRWGDRKLTDNWRYASSNNGNANIAANQANQPTSGVTDPDALPADMRKSTSQVSAGSYRQQLLQDMPTTPALLEQSNERIYNAYLDIANFYRDILEEKKEAIANYELLLAKYPNHPNKAPIYYSLYRLYNDMAAAESNKYKNRVLKEYPESVYAKVIIDPDYSKKLGDKDARLTEAYNAVYDSYSHRNFAQVITSADTLLKQYPANKYAAQIYYLRTIASGHLEKIAPFRTELEQIAASYPNDQLITPLVKQHMVYVDTNLPELTAQPFAIMNTDSVFFSPPVAYQKDAVLNRNRQFATIIEKPVEKPAEKPKEPEAKAATPPTVAPPPAPVNKPVDTAATIAKVPAIVKPTDTVARKVVIAAPPKKVSTLFNERDSTNYYFVVNVSTGTTDLSSSRFGIGQYNRINFAAYNISHQLKNAGPDNQLIYVGKFGNLEDAKKYARGIIPLMPQIMKVTADKYSYFIATQENLNKLANKKTLDDYIDYYQQTLLK